MEPDCTCGIGGFDHSADCAVSEWERSRPVAPVVCVFALVWNNGRVLLGERVDFGWGVPGGKADTPGRLEDHMLRELEEETGLKPHVLHPLPWWHEFVHPDGQSYSCVHYSAAVRGQEPIVKEPDKCLRWQWFRPHELPENTMPEVMAAVEYVVSRHDL